MHAYYRLLLRPRQDGFTLIELLVVVAIIGILASVVLSNMQMVRAKARDVIRTRDMHQMIAALQMYYDQNERFPCGNAYSTDTNFLQELTNASLLPKIKDPVNNEKYRYYYQSWKKVPGGYGCQIVEINYDIEMAGTRCVAGGKFVPNETSTHCHVFYPTPLPCSDPYLLDHDSSDCQALKN